MEDQSLVSCGVVPEDVEVEDEFFLKRRIACHPMFGLLKETHLNCLKVCLGDDCADDETDEEASKLRCDSRKNNNMENLTDLDLFMEAYYMALLELKKAIQEPMQEASTFIEFMHCLLDELTHPPTPITASASLEEEVGDEQGKCELLLCDCEGAVDAASEEIGRLGLRSHYSDAG